MRLNSESGHPLKERGFSSRSESLAVVLEQFGAALSVFTAGALPWILGSKIPLAGLILLWGTAAATICNLASSLLHRRADNGVPAGFLLLMGLAAIGTIQLMPIFSPLMSQMQHAVHAELRMEVSGDAAAHEPQTADASLTRVCVARWLCLSLLFLNVFDMLRTRTRLVACLAIMTANGCLLTTVAFIQMFRDQGMIFGEVWALPTENGQFGPFQNANTAAGWLCTHLAAASGLVLLTWNSTTQRQPGSALQRKLSGGVARSLRMQLAETMARLSTAQILSLAAAAFLAAGVAATRSRAGILSAVLGLATFVYFQFASGRSRDLLIPLALIGCGGVGLLIFLQQDSLVASEMATLSSPVQELSGRFRHWRESLRSVKDFPLIGSGMGAYRYSTPPYLSWGIEGWFLNADGQLIEMVVESGIIGLLCFSGAGVLMLFTGLRLINMAKNRGFQHHPEASAMGVIAAATAASQLVSALFDYGTGLAGPLSAIILIWGAATRVLNSTERIRGTAGASNLGFPVVWPSGCWLPFALKLGTLTGCCFYHSDLVAAHVVFSESLAIKQATEVPSLTITLDELNRLQSRLQDALKVRPNDLDGLQSLCRIQDACLRKQLILAAAGTSPVEENEYNIAWRSFSPAGLATIVQELRDHPNDPSKTSIHQDITRIAALSPYEATLRKTLAAGRLLPGLRIDLMAFRVVLSDAPISETEARGTLFVEPSGVRRLYQAGHLFLLQQQRDLCEKYWRESLQVSGAYRSTILNESLKNWTTAEAMDRFGPVDFEEAVTLASATKNSALQDELWQRSELFWTQLVPPYTREQQYSRAIQIRENQNAEVTEAWITECLSADPDHLKLRILLAEMLETAGRLDESLSEWYRIRYYQPQHTIADRAILRLNEKQRKAESESD
jgi:O-antigen ligase